MPIDEILFARAKRGDSEALGRLLKSELEGLRRYFFSHSWLSSWSARSAEADELAQETMVKFIRGFRQGGVKTAAHFLPYLQKTAKSVLCDAYRARRTVIQMIEHREVLESPDQDEDAHAARDELELVVESFRTLSPQEVDAIVLQSHGLSVDEIAVELGMHDKDQGVDESVRRRIRQTLWRARTKIKKYCKEKGASRLLVRGLRGNKVKDDDD